MPRQTSLNIAITILEEITYHKMKKLDEAKRVVRLERIPDYLWNEG